MRNLRYFRSFYQAYADRRPLIRDTRAESGTRVVPDRHDDDAGAPVAASRTGRGLPADRIRIRHEARAESDALLRGFSSRLSWTHYRTLLAVENPSTRAFYEIEADREGWSVATS